MHYEKFSDGSITCIEDIIPFTLPNGWRWSRLSSLCSDIQYGVSNSAENSGSHRLLRITDIQDGKVEWDKVPFTTLQSPEQYRLMTGDIVFARTGATVGKSFLIKELPFDSVYASYLIRIRLIGKLSRDYVYDFFNSKCYWNQITDKSVGVGQPNCNGSSLKELLIPVPPINEQELIIKSIKNLQLYSNIIESQQTDLKSLLLKCKSKILDLAIRGKLVSQDPNDEPASKLLERIRHEKEELIKAGKLKRDKRESVIFRGEDNSYYEKFGDGSIQCIDEAIPFIIPQGWCWCKLGTCLDVRDGTHDTPKYVTEGIPLVTSKNLNKGSIDFSNVKYISQADHYAISLRSKVDDNDILFAMIGSIGNPVLYHGEANFSIKNMALFKSIPNGMLMDYVFWWLYLSQNSMKKEAAGGLQGFVSLKYLRNFFIPVPPLPEQMRIINTIQTIITQFNSIEDLIKEKN